MALTISLIASNEGSYSDAEFSKFLTNNVANGVFNTNSENDFQVTESSPNAMTVDIDLGEILTSYTKDAVTWKVITKNSTTVVKTINSNSSGSDRVDAVIVHLTQDEPNSLKNNVAEVLVVLGTGTSALTDGAIDTSVGDQNWYRLADITVPDSAVSITNSDITDTRAKMGVHMISMRNNESIVGANSAGNGFIEILKIAVGDFTEFSSVPRLAVGRTLNQDQQVSDKKYVDDSINAVLPAGGLIAYGGASAPSGWLMCDGTAVSRTTYSNLFSAIGTTYGVGDGSTTFNVPDMQGNVAVGKDGGTFSSLADTGGAETHTLTADESGLPAHSHELHAYAGDNTGGFEANGDKGGSSPGDINAGVTDDNSSASASSAHNNLQPYLVTNYIIKT